MFQRQILYMLLFYPFVILLTFSNCAVFTESRIQAVNTGASDGLKGFKAHAVFEEINKKLQEVIDDLK